MSRFASAEIANVFAWQKRAKSEVFGLLIDTNGTIRRRGMDSRAVRDYACSHAVQTVGLRQNNLTVTFNNGYAASVLVTADEAKTFVKGSRGFPDAEVAI